LQLENAALHAPEHSSAGAGFSFPLSLALGFGTSVTTLVRVAIGGGEACPLVGAGTTK
jgi:hypothetical protein